MKNALFVFACIAFAACNWKADGFINYPEGTKYVVFYPDGSTDTLLFQQETWIASRNTRTTISTLNAAGGMHLEFQTNNPVKPLSLPSDFQAP